MSQFRGKQTAQLLALEKRYDLASANVQRRKDLRDLAVSQLTSLRSQHESLQAGAAGLEVAADGIEVKRLAASTRASFGEARRAQEDLQKEVAAADHALTFQTEWHRVEETDFDKLRRKYKVQVSDDGKAVTDAALARFEGKRPEEG